MRAVLLLVLMVLGCSRALAADGAAFNAIGYSPDSRYFAFEQYGVQDGSGFPYWDVFVIDLKTNEWVKGSPYRAMLESEEAKPAAARDQASITVEAEAADLGQIQLIQAAAGVDKAIARQLHRAGVKAQLQIKG